MSQTIFTYSFVYWVCEEKKEKPLGGGISKNMNEKEIRKILLSFCQLLDDSTYFGRSKSDGKKREESYVIQSISNDAEYSQISIK